MKNLKLFLTGLMLTFFCSNLFAQNTYVNALLGDNLVLQTNNTPQMQISYPAGSIQITTLAGAGAGLVTYNNTGTLGQLGFNPLSSTYFLSETGNWVNLASGPGGFWSLTGNAGTSPTNNFLGTTDGAALQFKVNNMEAGWIDFTAPDNTFLGYQAGLASAGNTSASGNVGIGYEVLNNNTGYDNDAIGYGALRTNGSGYANIGVGTLVLSNNTTGFSNAGMGHEALTSNTTGQYNVGIGNAALGANITGNYNTAVGGNAGSYFYACSGNTYLGYGTNANADGLSNSTALGNGSTITASNQVVIGNTAITQTLVQAGSLSLYQSGGNNSVFFGQDQFPNPSVNPGSAGSWGIQYVPASQNAGGMGGLNFWKPYMAGNVNNFGTNYGNGYLWLSDNGNVGIGTTTPASALDVSGTNPSFGQIANFRSFSTNPGGKTSEVFIAVNMPAIGDWNYLTKVGDNGIFWDDQSGHGNINSGFVIAPHVGSFAGIRIDPSGNVGIGTQTPGYTLDVNGIIRANEVKVCAFGTCDFVFEKDYKLMSLNELEEYLNLNHHLPGIASAKEMEEDGNVSLGKMDSQLLQKVEELTLYVIQQQKEIKSMQAKMDEMSKAGK